MNNQKSTLGNHRSPADICRERGWKVGTKIVGDECYGPTTLTIIAVGEKSILAKANDDEECAWTLCYRDWQLVK